MGLALIVKISGSISLYLLLTQLYIYFTTELDHIGIDILNSAIVLFKTELLRVTELIVLKIFRN